MKAPQVGTPRREPRASLAEPMGAHIVCLGNELVGDDGIGIRVGRVLSDLELPREVAVELRYNLGFDVLDLIEHELVLGDGTDASACGRANRLILVDAMSTGSPPGTCRVWTGAELLSRTPSDDARTCCHVVGLASVLEMAAKLWPDVVGACVFVVGIEGAQFTQYTTELTDAVRRALPQAVERVLGLAGAGADLLSRAQTACGVWLAREPTVAEACQPVGRRGTGPAP